MSGLIDVKIQGRVAVISMRRESKRNAVNRGLADAIDNALNRLDDNPDLWAGVLTGTSTAFSAGSDLTAPDDNSTERGGEYGIIRRRRRKPLVAAVEGYAFGGGFEMVLTCDLVVAASDATFALPEVKRGVVPTSGALFRGPRVLPLNVAREMMLTGETVSAERLERLGVVNVVTPPGGALDAAVALAGKITANAPLSIQACLAAFEEMNQAGDDLGWACTQRAMARIEKSSDMLEGVAAFLEKRPPTWTGR